MAYQDNSGQELKTLVEAQARTFQEMLSRIEASRENTGGLQEGSVGGDQPSYSEGPETSELVASASSRRDGENIDGLLPAVGAVKNARGSCLTVGSRETSSINCCSQAW